MIKVIERDNKTIEVFIHLFNSYKKFEITYIEREKGKNEASIYNNIIIKSLDKVAEFLNSKDIDAKYEVNYCEGPNCIKFYERKHNIILATQLNKLSMRSV